MRHVRCERCRKSLIHFEDDVKFWLESGVVCVNCYEEGIEEAKCQHI